MEGMDFFTAQETIFNHTKLIADDLEAVVAPVGQAFRMYRSQYGDRSFNRLDWFGKSPNYSGTYMIACVVARAITEIEHNYTGDQYLDTMCNQAFNVTQFNF